MFVCLFAAVVLRSLATNHDKLGTNRNLINRGKSRLCVYGRIINRWSVDFKFPCRQICLLSTETTLIYKFLTPLCNGYLGLEKNEKNKKRIKNKIAHFSFTLHYLLQIDKREK